MSNFARALIVVISTLVFLAMGVTKAQIAPIPISCGTILEAELSDKERVHLYSIELHPGDKLSIEAQPIGAALDTGLWLIDPSGGELFYVDNPGNKGNGGWPGQPDIVKDYEVGASGFYSLKVFAAGNPVGAYDLSIGCTLRDGTVIPPGGTLSTAPVQPTTPPNSNTSTSAALPDLTHALNKPFTPGAPMIGAISPNGSETFTYTLDAPAGGTLDLTFGKLSGNLNLSLVVLSSDNQILFQINLVNLGELKTSLTLPAAGTYTIGVYSTTLQPPAAPEATAFQVQGTLNP